MATIDILPLSVNGVQPPLNLLYNLFSSSSISDQNLMYPVDLASNPNYGHAIQFTVHEATYNIANEFNRIMSGGGVLGSTFNPSNFKLSQQKNILSTISLYMPDTLNVDFNNIYADSSLEETLGPGKYLAGAISDFASSLKGSQADKANFTNLYGPGLGVGLSYLASPNLGNLIGNVTKTQPNPQLQLLFKGVGLRTFQFTFIFTPTSSQEAKMVDNIMNAFQYYSAPSLLGQSQQFLKPPQVFDINFAFTSGSGLTGAVTNFFKNIGTNILSSQVSGSLFGSNQIDPTSNPAKVFKVYHPCVLKDISIDYAPNGWAAYDDGYPVQSTMTLTFQETDIVTKEDIRPVTNTSQTNNNNNQQSTPVSSGNQGNGVSTFAYDPWGSGQSTAPSFDGIQTGPYPSA
jgi:hypothetical protein